jgi:hypothetical protein
MTPSFREMFGRLFTAPNRSRSAKTVEVFGWLILIEGSLMLLAPRLAESVLQLPAFVEQGEHYFRLVGLLTGGLGMLYVVSGRLNSREFVFASMLDRPLVPFIMAVLWYRNILPGPLALAFSLQDFGSFLWTLLTWRGETARVGHADSASARR